MYEWENKGNQWIQTEPLRRHVLMWIGVLIWCNSYGVSGVTELAHLAPAPPEMTPRGVVRCQPETAFQIYIQAGYGVRGYEKTSKNRSNTKLDVEFYSPAWGALQEFVWSMRVRAGSQNFRKNLPLPVLCLCNTCCVTVTNAQLIHESHLKTESDCRIRWS